MSDVGTFPRVPIKHLADVLSGGTPSSNSQNWNGEVPFITPPDLNGLNGGLVESWGRTVTEAGAETGSTLVQNAVLISCRAPVGHIGTVRDEVSFNQGCKAVVPADEADLSFISKCLVADRKALQAASRGTTFTELSTMELLDHQIPWPEASIRRRIADYLDRETGEIDAMIDKLGDLEATLKTRRQTVISNSVIQNAQERPFLTCLSKIVDYRGRTPTKTDSGIQLVTARNIRQGWIDYETSKEYVNPAQYESIMSRGLPEYGDLLFTMEAPLGYVALVDRTDIALAQRIVKWTVDESVVTPKFLMYAVLGDVFQSELMIRATGSTALGIKASKFSELRILLPPLEDQRRIADHLDEVTSKIDAMLAKVAELKVLLTERRAALITDVVTGRKDVA